MVKTTKIPGSTGAWEAHGNGSGRRAIVNSYSHLEAGVYYLWESNSGIVYEPSKQFNDPVFDLPGLPNEFIRAQIDKFWNNEATYADNGFVHKRGILLYGPPGNGKSSVIASLIKKLVAEDGIVITVGSFRLASVAVQNLKKIEPKRKLMLLMEDMDTLLSGDYKSEEPHALSLLDGQAQVNGVVYVGTTNYPELLADRFIKRPGRFDLVIGMGNPIHETRHAYLKNVLPKVDAKTIAMIAAKTEGLSLSYLREIASSFLCLDVPIEESVGRLKANFTGKLKSSTQKNGSVGFKIGYDGEVGGALAAAATASSGVYTTDAPEVSKPSADSV